MKTNCWLILGVMISTSLVARQTTNAPASPPTAAAATNAPPAQPETKKAAKKKSARKSPAKAKDAGAELKTTPLLAGSATVIASNVNVRAQAKLKSEIITRVNKGQTVSVLEEVVLKHSAPDEPSAWAKIILPATAHAWVSTAFIDPTNKTVVPARLKLRAGPGENYSVLGMLKHGDAIKEVATKGEWMEIEAPAEAVAFVAAQYLRQEPGGTLAPLSVDQTPAPTVVPENPTVAAAPAEPPATPPATEPLVTPPAPPPPEPPAVEEPPPRRVVQREGFVRGTISIQAPTRYELVSVDTHKPINYLYTNARGLDLSRYKGMHIVVTGEEGLDERWRNTPVITIEKIQVLE